MLAYAYYGLHHGFESVSGRLNTAGMGWIILSLAAVQGLFGMVPAMYVLHNSTAPTSLKMQSLQLS